MSAIKVRGIKYNNANGMLCGSVAIQGCKNSALPILAATLLNGKANVIHNCPALSDVFVSIDILNSLGCRAVFENGTAVVDSMHTSCCNVPQRLMGAMRSSVIFAGALLSRCGRAEFTLPGGCDIGRRPIDIHLAAFEKMGVEVVCNEGNVVCTVDKLHSADIYLPLPSVGATENIMLLAARGKGVTRIFNAAREPEICDLQSFLNSMGARVFGAGSSIITIYAVRELHESNFTVMPDRIEAVTFACACAAAGGTLKLNKAQYEHMAAPMNVLGTMGLTAVPYADAVVVTAKRPMTCVPIVTTGPYPAFPTDAQSLVMSVMSCADGEGVVVENVFENRFGHASELGKMGADISVSGKRAVVRGKKLQGAVTEACDLRSGAALVVAGLAAEGETIVEHSEYIDRGYQDFVQKLSSIGACVERI
ncbi:MAG: UDP-N-acetylglucosamine 1-carboxyvinyltransferase [Clostridia bacterium]|nr:UDP-N-acetylglucosamine 1-carboxyvinyltransferase [Clostridia bacterium]